MNKQEAIESLQEMAKDSYESDYTAVVYIDNIVEIINKIDEPQKPVVPKFVAAWIGYKKGKGYTLFETLVEAVANPIIKEWLSKSRLELPTLAWIFWTRV